MRLLSFPLAILMASQTLVVSRYDCSVLSPTINARLSPRCREELLASDRCVFKKSHRRPQNHQKMAVVAVAAVVVQQLPLELELELELG